MDPASQTVALDDSNGDNCHHPTPHLSHDNIPRSSSSSEQIGNSLISPCGADTGRPSVLTGGEVAMPPTDANVHGLVLENDALVHPPGPPVNISSIQLLGSPQILTAREQKEFLPPTASDDSPIVTVSHKPLPPRTAITLLEDGKIVRSRPPDTARSYLETTAPCLLERYYMFRREAKTSNSES